MDRAASTCPNEIRIREMQRAVFFGRMEAQRADSDTITPHHLVTGILLADKKLAAALLPHENLRDVAAAIGTSGQHASHARRSWARLKLPFHESCREVLRSAKSRMLGRRRPQSNPRI
jgi:hypothetical protein